MSAADDGYVVHAQCGFPIFVGRDGNWHHENAGDAIVCDLIGGGGMLAALMDEEPGDQE